jgi:hypothetical protein
MHRRTSYLRLNKIKLKQIKTLAFKKNFSTIHSSEENDETTEETNYETTYDL